MVAPLAMIPWAYCNLLLPKVFEKIQLSELMRIRSLRTHLPDVCKRYVRRYSLFSLQISSAVVGSSLVLRSTLTRVVQNNGRTVCTIIKISHVKTPYL